MKIKTKLLLSLGFLFLMILVVASLSIRQVRLMEADTKKILVANYQSLDYARNMQKILDENEIIRDGSKFLHFLDKQSANITEIGEQELTSDLREDFDAMMKSGKTSSAFAVRRDLNDIMKLNMDAIKRKSLIAEKTAQRSVLWISVTSAFCVLVGLTLIVNIPGHLANPIRNITESIRQIAAMNYGQRVRVDGHDEFAALARSFNSMAEKLEEYSNSNLAKLMREKQRVETLVGNLKDPVLGLDENRKVLFINDEALKISGLSANEVIGRPANEVALRNDLLRSLLQRLGSSHDTEPPAILKIYANGRESYFENLVVLISITPTGESEQKNIGTFIILRNVTAHKELDQAKTNFIATVSHEFKTPIASMKMSIQLLEDKRTGLLNEQQRDLVNGLKDDMDRLLRTTSELLDITQVETGKSLIKTEKASLLQIVHDALGSVQTLAAQKKVFFSEVIAPDMHDILTDYPKAVWIISNLLSNAVRHSYDNSKVEIVSNETPTHFEISVIDHGVGIEAKYHSRLFEKYFRIPGKETGGTGLGLAISKEFMEAMDGYLTVSSEIGKGSTFTAGFAKYPRPS